MSGSGDVDRIIAEVAKTHGILLKPNDPALLLVTIAHHLLDESFAKLDRKMTARFADFDQSVRSVEIRAGKALAEVVRTNRPIVSPADSKKEDVQMVAIPIPAFAAGLLLGSVVTLITLNC